MSLRNKPPISFLNNWKYTILVGILVSVVLAAVIQSAYTSNLRFIEGIDKDTDEIKKDSDIEFIHIMQTRDELMGRCTNFEQLLVGIGSVELGILAYLAGLVLAGKSPIQTPKTFFFLSIILILVTSIAYLHTFKIYTSYAAQVVRLELCFKEPLKTTGAVFFYAMNPNISSSLQWITTALGTLQVVAMYPIALFAAGTIAFGRKLKIPLDAVLAITIGGIGWALLYVMPTCIEFFRLVNYSQNG